MAFCENQKQKSVGTGINIRLQRFWMRATDGARTRDPDLGKVVLYQLSHCRTFFVRSEQKIYYYMIADLSILFSNFFILFFSDKKAASPTVQ